MWLVAAILDTTDRDYFQLCSKFYWTWLPTQVSRVCLKKGWWVASGLGRQAPCRHCLASATGSLVEAPALLCPSLIRGLFSILSSSGLGVLVPEAHLQRSLVG